MCFKHSIFTLPLQLEDTISLFPDAVNTLKERDTRKDINKF